MRRKSASGFRARHSTGKRTDEVFVLLDKIRNGPAGLRMSEGVAEQSVRLGTSCVENSLWQSACGNWPVNCKNCRYNAEGVRALRAKRIPVSSVYRSFLHGFEPEEIWKNSKVSRWLRSMLQFHMHWQSEGNKRRRQEEDRLSSQASHSSESAGAILSEPQKSTG